MKMFNLFPQNENVLPSCLVRSSPPGTLHVDPYETQDDIFLYGLVLSMSLEGQSSFWKALAT